MKDLNKNLLNYIQSLFPEPIYAVGGFCRDTLLGLEPKDYDFASSMPTETIKNCLKGKHRVYCTGERFGTLGFRVNGLDIEITQFRTEKYTNKSRKPQVEFVNDVVCDLSRRDFTINAMAYRVDNNKIIDPFNGKGDLANKKLRCVGRATTRIKEDPLRILRGARFASRFNLEIDEEFEKRAKEYGHRLLDISKERWVMELDKLLMTDNPKIGFDFLLLNGIIKYIIPELQLQLNYNQNNPHHGLTLYEHTMGTVALLKKDVVIRWAGLLHDIAKPFCRIDKEDKSSYYKHELLGAEIVEKTANYLKWSNERKNQVKSLVLNHMEDESPLKEADKSSRGF